MFTVKDSNRNTYYAINAYSKENIMYSSGEWLEKTKDGRYYAGTYYVSKKYRNNIVYIGYNSRDYEKYQEGATIGYFLESNYIEF